MNPQASIQKFSVRLPPILKSPFMPLISPAPLKKNDLILLVAPAKAIETSTVLYAKDYLESQGFRVEIAPHTTGQYNYFSGTDFERTSDFQWALEHPEAKAIICARGGYGCIRVFDYLQWANQLRNPKWIVGFSDVTVFHQYLQKMGIESLHATMPLNFASNSTEALRSLLETLTGKSLSYALPAHPKNSLGTAEGTLIGGNFSILYSLLGTSLQTDYRSSILFIEDVGEAIYAIDRMMYAFKHAGILDQLAGLIVGGMTQIRDSEVPFGASVEEVILSHFQFRKIPIVFDFPAGHINDNRALILGRAVKLEVSQIETKLTFTENE